MQMLLHSSCHVRWLSNMLQQRERLTLDQLQSMSRHACLILIKILTRLKIWTAWINVCGLMSSVLGQKRNWESKKQPLTSGTDLTFVARSQCDHEPVWGSQPGHFVLLDIEILTNCQPHRSFQDFIILSKNRHRWDHCATHEVPDLALSPAFW